MLLKEKVSERLCLRQSVPPAVWKPALWFCGCFLLCAARALERPLWGPHHGIWGNNWGTALYIGEARYARKKPASSK